MDHENNNKSRVVRDFIGGSGISLYLRLAIYFYILFGVLLWAVTGIGLALAVEWAGLHISIGFVAGIVISTLFWSWLGRKLRHYPFFKWLYPHDSRTIDSDTKAVNPRDYVRRD